VRRSFSQAAPQLGPLVKPPFYAVDLYRIGGSAIPSTGLAAIVIAAPSLGRQADRGPLRCGNSMARMETGAVMQSGVSNARGMTHGYLAGRHAAGQHPSDLLKTSRAPGP